MTDELRLLIQRSAQNIRASDRLYAELLERPRRTAGRRRVIVGASALAACAVLLAVFTFRTAILPAPTVRGGASIVVTGQLFVVGGPAPGSPRPVPGSIDVHHGTATDGPIVASVDTGTDGRFIVEMPAGTYELTGRSPMVSGGRSECLSEPVTVSRSKPTAAVAVYCHIR